MKWSGEERGKGKGCSLSSKEIKGRGRLEGEEEDRQTDGHAESYKNLN